MKVGSRHILRRQAGRCVQRGAALAVLPVLVLSPLTSSALLIHDHHGHDTHGHTVAFYDLDELQESSEHQHEEHDQDGQLGDPAEDERAPFLIVVDSPEPLRRGRTFSACAAVAFGLGARLRTFDIGSWAADEVRPPIDRRPALASVPRAYGLVTAILLTSHALLL